MAAEPAKRPHRLFVAGDHVQVTDVTHSRHGKTGTVAFFVADNIYVKFADVRWMATTMFFPDQLRPAPAVQTTRKFSPVATFLRKLRL